MHLGLMTSQPQAPVHGPADHRFLSVQKFAEGIGNLGRQVNRLGKQIGDGRGMVAANRSSDSPKLLLAGRWNKDKSASDMEGYGRSLDLMGIHGIKKKTAMMLMDGVEIMQDDTGFTTQFVTKVPQWRPTEAYSFEGPVRMSRRDQRKGLQTAIITQQENSIHVEISWDEPVPGRVREIYRVQEAGRVLCIESMTTINDVTESAVQVYRRRE